MNIKPITITVNGQTIYIVSKDIKGEGELITFLEDALAILKAPKIKDNETF